MAAAVLPLLQSSSAVDPSPSTPRRLHVEAPACAVLHIAAIHGGKLSAVGLVVALRGVSRGRQRGDERQEEKNAFHDPFLGRAQAVAQGSACCCAKAISSA